MKIQQLLAAATIFGAICINCCDGQRTKDKMYEPINGMSACFRRLNGTHQIGCSSSREGSTGIVHFLSSPADVDVVLKLQNGLHYIPVMSVRHFDRPMVDLLGRSKQITGLVVYQTNESMASYSHEDSCPNRDANLAGTCDRKWNVPGTGLLLADFPFPVFYVDEDEEVDKLRDCFNKFNNFSYETHGERSLCSLELKGFMFASIDTPTCLRRSQSNVNLNPVKFCDPMGDQNVWASIFPLGNSDQTPAVHIKKDMKYVIVAARMDTTTMFHDLTPGAVNPITGMVTLLSTARLIRRMITSFENGDKNVLFILFNGESYDYIGSQRIVYDMQHADFPVPAFYGDGEEIPNVKLENVHFIVEISQMSDSGTFYVHTNGEPTPLQRDFINVLKVNNKDIGLNLNESVHLPPTSLHSFIKADNNISGIVVADHGDRYRNQFYNSIFDDSENIGFTYVNGSAIPEKSIQEHLSLVSELLAKTIYETVKGNKYTGDEKADRLIVNELLHCYLENANCSIHQAIQKGQFKQIPLSTYVGVTVAANLLPRLVGLTLAWFTGEIVPTQDNSCTRNMTSYVYRYFNMSESLQKLNETRCFRTSMNLTEAESPAFLIEDYDWKSGQYSTWSESTWREFSVRIFLRPSGAHEAMTIAVGAVTFLLSTGLVYLLNAKAQLLFETNIVTPTSC